MSGTTTTTATQTPPATSRAAASAAASTATSAGSRIAQNFDTFLTLLTTQLRNQDPTQPLDANEMTAQLVQFAGVEQQIAMNRNLEQLVSIQQAAQLTAAAPLMGRRVEVESDQLSLQSGQAELRLPAAGVATAARVAVLDSGGRTLREETVTLGSGATRWRWDGRTAAGQQLPDGAYRVAVTGATAGGSPAAIGFTVVGTATAAEQQGGALRLALGALTVGFDKVRGVSGGS
jgi:flagellar basal-body rod modification protein FlgD